MEYRIGKSAGGEMHLSAACLCTECNMLVEMGTDDCPHSAAMGKPLPPTAEQTSIARFNALADELRKLGKELKATGDALADAMSHNFDDLQAEFSAKLDRIAGTLVDSHNFHKCDHESVMMVLGSFENRLIEHLSHASQMEIATRESLKERQDQDREAFSSWISAFEVAISIKLEDLARDSARRHNRHDSEHMNLDKKIDSLTPLVPDGLFSFRQRMERALLRIERRLRATRAKPNVAVAKKKAAPLVGKRRRKS